MLRITLEKTGRTKLLRLEGALRDAWVVELRDAVTKHNSRSPLSLDLSRVSYVDGAGIELLRELHDRGTRIEACSDFVAACLGWDTP